MGNSVAKNTRVVHGGSARLLPANSPTTAASSIRSAELGDVRCKIDLTNALYRRSGTVRK
jgi:hypothetical protein